MELMDRAELKLIGTYHPFDGLLGDPYIDLEKSLAELLEEEQLDYNPMVGAFTLSIKASFTVDGAGVVEKDGKLLVENYDELFESGECNVEELIDLRKACETKANWKINEDKDGISANIVTIRMSALKAYDYRFDISVDTGECADAISGDMQSIVEKAMQLQSYARETDKDNCLVDDCDIGVVVVHDIKYEKNLLTNKLIQWILNNLETAVVNYVATAVYVLAIDPEQAYYDMDSEVAGMFEKASEMAGFTDHKETSSKYKWVYDI